MIVLTLPVLLLPALQTGGDAMNPWALEVAWPTGQPAPVEAVGEDEMKLPESLAWLEDLQVRIYGNFLGNRDDKQQADPDGNQLDDRLRLREVDLDFEYQITEEMRGVVILSYESDPVSTHESDLAEGWLGYERAFGDGDKWHVGARAGKFRSQFGQNSRLRIFELPQPTRPLPVRYYLGEDGFTSTGFAGRLAYRMADEHVLALNVEGANAGDLPLTDAVGEQPFATTIKAGYTFTGEQYEADAGVSHYDGRKQPARLTSLELRLTRRSADPEGAGTVHFGGEYLTGQTEFDGLPKESPAGYYVWGMVAVHPKWYLGARIDRAEEVSDDSLVTKSWGAYVTYVLSDYVRAAVGWESFQSDVAFNDDRNTVYFELNFALGAKPRQPNWVR